MKKLIVLLIVLLACTSATLATDVTISATTITQLPFNPTSIGSDRTFTVTVTNGSSTVTSSAAFPSNIVGIGGFQILIGSTQYVVSGVASTSSLTLTTNYVGSSGSATMTLYKYTLFRGYATAGFQDTNGQNIQPGTPGSGNFFRQVAVSVINNGSNNIAYMPAFVMPSTTDAVSNNQARFVFAWYRTDNSLLAYYMCGSVQQLALQPNTPTTWTAICNYNSPGGVVPPNTETYTKTQIDQRFASCSQGQSYYFASNGNIVSCLNFGSGLTLIGNTLTATGGGGGGSPGGAVGSIQYNNSGSFGGYTLGQQLTVSGTTLQGSGLRGAINAVVDYGCAPDGTTNNTVCVSNALAAAISATSKILYFPAGTYLIDPGTLTLATNSVILIGDGPGKTVLKNRSAGAVITLNNASAITHSISIRDMSLTGFGTGSSDVGLLVTGSGQEPFNLTVSNVRISNVAGRGIYATSNLFTSRFEDVDVSVLAAGSNGIDIGGAADILLQRCYVHSVGTNGAAYRIHAGVVTMIACNGIDSGTNADWLVLGDSTGTGDPSNRFARAVLIGCNIEAFTNRGVYAKSGSYVSRYEGVTFLAPASGTVTPVKYDFVDTGQRGTIDAATSFTTLGAAYANSSAIHSNGAPFLQIGGTQFATYYDTNVAGAVTLPYATASLIPGSTNVAFDISRGRISALESSTLVGDLTGANAFTGNASRVLLQNGTDVRPTLAQASSLATGMYFAASNQIGFTSNGSQKLLLTTSSHTLTGNLGINTSGSAGYALDVASGAARITNSNGSSTAVIEGRGNNNPYFLLTDTSASAIIGRMQALSGAPDRLTIGTFSNHPLGLYSNSTEKWTIGTTGHLTPGTASTYNIGSSSLPINDLTMAGRHYWNGTTVFDFYGSGTPEASITASVGSVYRRTNGGSSTTLYVKESGSGNTGWAAVRTTAGTLSVSEGGTGATTFTTNGVLYGNGTSAIQVTAASGGGTSCLVSTGGGAPAWGACSGSAATALSSITAAMTSNTVASGDNAQVWQWSISTASKTAWTITESAASSGASSYLLRVNTLATSTAKPLIVTAGGTADGVEMSTAGSLGAIGAGGIVATTGDSATAFFSAGQIEAARGGTGSDSSASTGIPRVTAGTWTYNAGIAQLATSTSADLRGVLSDETGSGVAVFATSPTLVTPVLGVATATSINGLTITASTGTLTIANGKTATISNTLTLAGTDGTTMTFPGTSGAVATADSTTTFTNKTYNTAGTGNAFSINSQSITTVSGNTSKVGTTGTPSSGKCLEWDANGNIVTAVSNAACGSGGGSSPPFSDATALVMNSVDNTKRIQFSAASISTGVTRTYTGPDASGILVLEDNTATLTNKTLDSASNNIILPFSDLADPNASITFSGTTFNTTWNYSTGLQSYAWSGNTGSNNAFALSHSNTTATGTLLNLSTSASVSVKPLTISPRASQAFQVDHLGNTIIGSAALSTSATNGFLYLVSSAGTPTGVPTTYTGRVPLEVDTTNSRLYGYFGGAWVNLTGSGGGGSPGGSNTQVQYNNAGSFAGISGFTTDGTNVTAGSGNLRATRPQITTSLDDSNGNELFVLTATASAVNEITVANAATGNNPTLTASGGDTNVGINFVPKGSGTIQVSGVPIVTTTATQTLTNKTLTAPVIATISNTGTLTLPTSTDTLVGRATTDTLTNKTLTASTNVLGGVTMTLGSDATGDVYYRNSGGQLTRLAIGSNGNCLVVTTGLPAWSTCGSGTITGSGTTGTIAKFTGSSAIGDSILSESSTTLTLAGRQTINGLTISTDANNTVASLTANSTFTKNNTNSRTFFGVLVKPTFNFGGSNTNTEVNVLQVDSTNTATTGTIFNLLHLKFGGSTVFNVDSAGAITFANGVRQAFVPDTLTASLNVGQVASDPSNGVNGDMVYQTGTNKFRCYENSAWTNCIGSGGGGSPGGSNTQLQYNNSSSFGGISGVTSDGTNVTAGSGNLRATSPRITTALADSNGNQAIGLTATSSAVNSLNIANSATGGSVTLSTVGSDTQVKLHLSPKGSSYPNGPQVTFANGVRYDQPEISWPAPLGAYGIHQNSGGGWMSINANNLALGAGGAQGGAAARVAMLANTTLNWSGSTATPIDDADDSAHVLMGRRAADTLRFGPVDTDLNTAVRGQTLSVQGVASGGTANQAGKDWTFQASRSKGTGAGGGFVFQVSPAGSSGATLNSYQAAVTIAGDRTTTFAAGISGTTATFSGAITVASCTGCGGGGSGTVTSFSSGNLSPLFTTSVSNATTTPALSFSLSNAGANTYFGNAVGTSGAPSFTAAGALTKTDDTNVTLTLGGAPSTALLNNASLTLGWTGTLAAGRLNSNVVQAVTNDTNITGSISAQTLTLGFTGTLAKGRQNSATVYTDAGNTFSTGAQSFAAASSLVIPTSAGAAPTANATIAYDSTANAYKFGVNGATKTVLMTDGSGASLTNLNASNLASGTVPDAQFPATLPAASGANLTALNASNLGSGTVPLARLSGITNTEISASAAIANSKLANSAITIAGTSTALGSSISLDTITGLSSTGIIKRTAANTLAVAVSGTDYAPATSGSSILYGNGSGGFSNVTVGTGLSFSAGTLSSTAGSPAWSALTNPSGVLSLSMGTNVTTFTWGTGTSTNNLFTLKDTSGNTGTGYVLSVENAGTSTVKPFRVLSNTLGGGGIEVRNDGILYATGTGGINAAALISGTVPLGRLSGITNTEIASGAAIAYSKLNLATSIVNADVSNSAAIAYSKLNLATSIVNADISTSAAIARSKIAAGTASHVVINDGSGNLSSEASLAVSRGGTGQTSYTDGQLLIGNTTGNTLAKATLTAGSNVAITNGAGSITVAAFTGSQTANTVFAAPNGSSGTPAFRALAAADVANGLLTHGKLTIPYAEAEAASAQSIPNTTLTVINLGTEIDDNDGMHSTVTNTSRITASTTGKYLITGTIPWDIFSSGARVIARIYKNGTGSGTVIADIDQSVSSSDLPAFNLTAVVQLTAGDYVELVVFHTMGSSVNLYNDAALKARMSAIRIGGLDWFGWLLLLWMLPHILNKWRLARR